MTRTWRLVAAMAFCALVAPAVAQTTESESAAVLQEVRLLRQAIEALAHSSVVSHINFGRLQIQEQRLVAASNELKGITESLDHVLMMIEHHAESAKAMDAEDTNDFDPKRREQHRRAVEQFKREQESLEMRRQQLTVERSNVEQRLGLEQAEWSSLSQKLDELERGLARRRP
jgi:acetyl/propionyl-CoA carboxylase alpha subunit